MSDRRQDFDLLQRFTRCGEQSAFADLVRRHLDLVFATALRKVEDAGVAQEIAQNVFVALARKAWRFAPDDSLPAWLHKAALLESKSWLRGELSRRRREVAAAELGTTMHPQEEQPAIQALLPLLDEGLLSLREKDRTALLLRFYESRSLREVGAAFSVSEDTAQKRVQSALQKLAEFFKARGFQTASVAAAAAALQNSATSASASVLSAVMSAALPAASPALGLSAVLARLVSLSRFQTGALCVVLAALPLGWQLERRQAAVEEAKAIQAQLLDGQNQYAAAQSDVERLKADSQRLELSLVQANETAMRAAESAKTFDLWKKKIRVMVMADDYRWPDESPFVRIPKSALTSLAKLSYFEPFATPGIVRPSARDLLGLTPEERQSIEEALHRHFIEVETRRANLLYETNKASSPFPQSALATKTFVTPGVDDAGKEIAQRATEELHRLIGEERWQLLSLRGRSLEKILTSAYSWPGEVRLCVEPGNSGPRLQVSFDGILAGSQSYPLSIFLPDGDPGKVAEADRPLTWMPELLRQRILTWAQEQAIALLARKKNP